MRGIIVYWYCNTLSELYCTGMFDSNSLHFELVHKWTGLLVEPVADFFTAMEGAHRLGMANIIN